MSRINISEIIIEPLDTEKATILKENDPKKYAFYVNKHANKYQIASAFYTIFGLKPTRINIVVRKPKPIRTGTKTPGYIKLAKIAYITLAKGYELNLEDKSVEKEAEQAIAKEKEKKGILTKISDTFKGKKDKDNK